MSDTTTPTDELAEMRERLATLEGRVSTDELARQLEATALRNWAPPDPPPTPGYEVWEARQVELRKLDAERRAAEQERFRIALEERAGDAPARIAQLRAEIAELETEASPYVAALRPIQMQMSERRAEISALSKIIDQVVAEVASK